MSTEKLYSEKIA